MFSANIKALNGNTYILKQKNTSKTHQISVKNNDSNYETLVRVNEDYTRLTYDATRVQFERQHDGRSRSTNSGVNLSENHQITVNKNGNSYEKLAKSGSQAKNKQINEDYTRLTDDVNRVQFEGQYGGRPTNHDVDTTENHQKFVQNNDKNYERLVRVNEDYTRLTDDVNRVQFERQHDGRPRPTVHGVNTSENHQTTVNNNNTSYEKLAKSDAQATGKHINEDYTRLYDDIAKVQFKRRHDGSNHVVLTAA